MLATNQFNFDDIVCPNSFEDDPELDAFFDKMARCSDPSRSDRNARPFGRHRTMTKVGDAVGRGSTHSGPEGRIGRILRRKAERAVTVAATAGAGTKTHVEVRMDSGAISSLQE